MLTRNLTDARTGRTVAPTGNIVVVIGGNDYLRVRALCPSSLLPCTVADSNIATRTQMRYRHTGRKATLGNPHSATRAQARPRARLRYVYLTYSQS